LQVFSGFIHHTWICADTIRYSPVKRNASFFDTKMVTETVPSLQKHSCFLIPFS